MDSIIINEEEGTATIMSIMDFSFTSYRDNPLIKIVQECVVCEKKNTYRIYARSNAPSNKKHYQLKISEDVLLMLKLGGI